MWKGKQARRTNVLRDTDIRDRRRDPNNHCAYAPVAVHAVPQICAGAHSHVLASAFHKTKKLENKYTVTTTSEFTVHLEVPLVLLDQHLLKHL